MDITIEHALRQAHDKASLLRFMADAAMTAAEADEADVERPRGCV